METKILLILCLILLSATVKYQVQGQITNMQLFESLDLCDESQQKTLSGELKQKDCFNKNKWDIFSANAAYQVQVDFSQKDDLKDPYSVYCNCNSTPVTDIDVSECCRIGLLRNVIPFESNGSITDTEKEYWFNKNCNEVVGDAFLSNCKVIANNNFLTCIKTKIDAALALFTGYEPTCAPNLPSLSDAFKILSYCYTNQDDNFAQELYTVAHNNYCFNILAINNLYDNFQNTTSIENKEDHNLILLYQLSCNCIEPSVDQKFNTFQGCLKLKVDSIIARVKEGNAPTCLDRRPSTFQIDLCLNKCGQGGDEIIEKSTCVNKQEYIQYKEKQRELEQNKTQLNDVSIPVALNLKQSFCNCNGTSSSLADIYLNCAKACINPLNNDSQIKAQVCNEPPPTNIITMNYFSTCSPALGTNLTYSLFLTNQLIKNEGYEYIDNQYYNGSYNVTTNEDLFQKCLQNNQYRTGQIDLKLNNCSLIKYQLNTIIIDFIVLNYDDGKTKTNYSYPPMNFINIDQNQFTVQQKIQVSIKTLDNNTQSLPLQFGIYKADFNQRISFNQVNEVQLNGILYTSKFNLTTNQKNFIWIINAQKVTLQNIQLSGFYNPLQSGAIFINNSQTVNIIDCSFQYNQIKQNEQIEDLEYIQINYAQSLNMQNILIMNLVNSSLNLNNNDQTIVNNLLYDNNNNGFISANYNKNFTLINSTFKNITYDYYLDRKLLQINRVQSVNIKNTSITNTTKCHINLDQNQEVIIDQFSFINNTNGLIEVNNRIPLGTFTIIDSIFDNNIMFDEQLSDFTLVQIQYVISLNIKNTQILNCQNCNFILNGNEQIMIDQLSYNNNKWGYIKAIYIQKNFSLINSIFNNTIMSGEQLQNNQYFLHIFDEKSSLNIKNTSILNSENCTVSFKDSKETMIDQFSYINNTNGFIILDYYENQNFTLINSIFSQNTQNTWFDQPEIIQVLMKITSNEIIIKNCIFENVNYGGAIQINQINEQSSLLIENCTASQNQGFDAGFLSGKIQSCIINNSKFDENKANNKGGAFYLQSKTIQITNSQFSSNPSSYGGAFYIEQFENITIVNSSFQSNTALMQGGAIFAFNNLSKPTVTLSNSQFKSNTANQGGGLYVTSNLIIIKNDCNFSKNTANYGGVLYFNQTESVQIYDSYFQSNTAQIQGGALYFYQTKSIKIQNSLFELNLAQLQGGAIFAQNIFDNFTIFKSNFTFNLVNKDTAGVLLLIQSKNSTLNISQSNFNFNKANNQGIGGVLFVDDMKQIILDNNQFRENSAYKVGVLSFSSINTLNIQNCDFIQNRATDYGVMFLNSLNETSIQNCKFINNFAQNTNAVFQLNDVNYLTFLRNIFESNQALINNGVGGISQGDILTIQECNFTSNMAKQGNSGALYLNQVNTTNISNTNFTQNWAIQGGSIQSEQSKKLFIQNCFFQSNTAQELGGAILIFNNSDLLIINSTFQNNSALIQGGAIQLKENYNNSTLINVTFNDNYCQQGANLFSYGGAISIENLFSEGYVYLNGIQANNNRAQTGGVIYINDITNFIVEKCNFTNSMSDLGGTLKITQVGDTKIIQSNFSSSQSKYAGGVIHVDYKFTNISIDKCQFTNNSAGNGGSFFIEGDFNKEGMVNNRILLQIIKQQITIENTQFSKNSADNSGGAIEIKNVQDIKFNTVEISNCTAQESGGGISVRDSKNLILSNVDFINNAALDKRETNDSQYGGGAIYVGGSLETFNATTIKFVNNTSSQQGGAALLDISKETTIQLSVNINDVLIAGNTAQLDGGGLMIKKASCLNLHNTNFTGNSGQNAGAIQVQIVNQPNNIDQLCLNITNNKFEENKAQYMIGSMKIVGLDDDFTRGVSMKIAETNQYNNNQEFFGKNTKPGFGCVFGEFIDMIGDCQKCETNFYSMDGKGFKCKACPNHIVCKGGYSRLETAKNYWRVNNYSEKAYYCEKGPERCLGNDTCQIGHNGPFCELCDSKNGYKKDQTGKCGLCGSKFSAWISIIIVVLVTVFLSVNSSKNNLERYNVKQILWVLRKLFNFFHVKKDDMTAITKIIVNHFQILSIIMSIDINIPFEYVVVVKSIGEPTNVMINSQKCIFENSTIQDAYYQQYVNYIIMLIMYSLIVILLAVLQLKSSIKMRYSIPGSTLFFFMYLQPSMVKNMTGFLNARDVLGEQLVFHDLTLLFNSYDHMYFVSYCVIPSLIFWMVILCSAIYYVLIKQQRILNDKTVDPDELIVAKKTFTLSFDFLIAGYKDQRFFWELTYIITRILLIVINELLNSRTAAKICFFAIVVLINYQLQIIYKPYINKTVNELAQLSLIIQVTSLIVCLPIQGGEDVKNGLLFSLIMLILLLGLNAIFFIKILLVMIPQILQEQIVLFYKVFKKMKIMEAYTKRVEMKLRISYYWGVLRNASIIIVQDYKENNDKNLTSQLNESGKYRLQLLELKQQVNIRKIEHNKNHVSHSKVEDYKKNSEQQVTMVKQNMMRQSTLLNQENQMRALKRKSTNSKMNDQSFDQSNVEMSDLSLQSTPRKDTSKEINLLK